MKNPFPIPLRVVEREKDGSVYIEGGDPSARHIAFDVACTKPEAEFIAYAVREVALMADPKCETPGKEWCIFVEDDFNDMGKLLNSRFSAVQNLVAILEEMDDGESITMTISRKDMTKAEIKALPEL